MSTNSRALLAFAAVCASLFITPMIAFAAQAVVNKDCLPEKGMCQYGTYCDKPKNTIKGVVGKPCKDIEKASGITITGKCVAPGVCRTQSAPGMDGKNALDQAMQMLKGLLDKMMQQGGQGGGQGSGTGQGSQNPSSLYPACQTNPATGTITSVPCVDSTGAVITSPQGTNPLTGFGSSTGSIADTLLNALGETDAATQLQEEAEEQASVSSLLQDTVSQTRTDDSDSVQSTDPNLSSETATGVPTTGQDSAQLKPEERGDILTSGTGATIVAGTRSQSDNSEVAGFVGSNTSGFSQPTTIVGKLCESRPWSSGFLSTIIAPSFFDGLCVWRGYHVGSFPENPVAVTPYVLRNPDAAARVQRATTGGADSNVEPAVDVWASPPSVSLGTRTSIFWASQGVANCVVAGPSFSQEGTSGGAATVPISGASVFTVICTDPDGEEVARDSVTVNLAI